MSAGSSAPGSPLSADEVTAIRAALPAVTATTYLNAATLGPLPHAAAAAMAAARAHDEQLRQGDDLWERIDEAQFAARAAIATLTGCAVEQIALMHSTHEGINTCAWGLDLRAEDEIVTTDQEHAGVLVPLRHVAARSGCTLRVARWDATSDDAFVRGILEACSPRTRAVFVSHVSWLTGEISPLRLVREALPDHVRLVVDGAQAAGALVVDPADGWNAYTVSGQKWPCGPNSTGGLALADPDAWQPTFGGDYQLSDMSDPLGAPLVAGASRFETSQKDSVPLVGLAASVQWLAGEIGIDRAAAHSRALNAVARQRAQAVLGERLAAVHGPAHILGLDLHVPDMSVIASRVNQLGIPIPRGHRRIRISLGAWTTPTEVDAVVAALAQACDELTS